MPFLPAHKGLSMLGSHRLISCYYQGLRALRLYKSNFPGGKQAFRVGFLLQFTSQNDLLFPNYSSIGIKSAKGDLILYN